MFLLKDLKKDTILFSIKTINTLIKWSLWDSHSASPREASAQRRTNPMAIQIRTIPFTMDAIWKISVAALHVVAIIL